MTKLSLGIPDWVWGIGIAAGFYYLIIRVKPDQIGPVAPPPKPVPGAGPSPRLDLSAGPSDQIITVAAANAWALADYENPVCGVAVKKDFLGKMVLSVKCEVGSSLNRRPIEQLFGSRQEAYANYAKAINRSSS